LSIRLAQRIGEAMQGLGFDEVEVEMAGGETVMSFR
jgi:hypothetical protein